MKIKWTAPTIGAIFFLAAGIIAVALKALGIWIAPPAVVAFGLLAGMVSILAAGIDQIQIATEPTASAPSHDPIVRAMQVANMQVANMQIALRNLARDHQKSIRVIKD